MPNDPCLLEAGNPLGRPCIIHENAEDLGGPRINNPFAFECKDPAAFDLFAINREVFLFTDFFPNTSFAFALDRT